MDFIRGPGNNNGRFVDKDPNANPPVPGTQVTAKWLNSLLDELIVNIIQRAGLEPSGTTNDQVYQALTQLLVTPAELANALHDRASSDLANINSAGKAVIATTASHAWVPSDNYIGLSAITSPQEYTAPMDGYFTVIAVLSGSAASSHVNLYHKKVPGLGIMTPITTDGVSKVFLPAKAGDVVGLDWQNANITAVNFVLAEGPTL